MREFVRRLEAYQQTVDLLESNTYLDEQLCNSRLTRRVAGIRNDVQRNLRPRLRANRRQCESRR